MTAPLTLDELAALRYYAPDPTSASVVSRLLATIDADRAVLAKVLDWLDGYYGDVHTYDDGTRTMDQFDHGYQEYEFRMGVATAVRGWFEEGRSA